jgi:hypothetical protein
VGVRGDPAPDLDVVPIRERMIDGQVYLVVWDGAVRDVTALSEAHRMSQSA